MYMQFFFIQVLLMNTLKLFFEYGLLHYWNRKNYNKAPLAFLSDIFYWQDKKHPILDVIKMFLVNFNDYFVENLHSQIRANTSSSDSVEAIIKQTCILGMYKI